MSRLKNFLKNLQNPADREKVAATLGKNLNEVMSEPATHPAISGNNNNKEEGKKMENVILGYTASGQPITQKDQERDLYGWHTRCATFTEIGSAAYELMQSMTSSSRMAGVCETNGDLDFEIARTKKLLAAVD